MTIFVAPVTAAARVANGNDKNSKRPLNFFVAFPKGALQRATLARRKMGNDDAIVGGVGR